MLHIVGQHGLHQLTLNCESQKAKAQKFILAEMHEICAFQFGMCEMHKTADFHSNLLVTGD